MGRMTAIATSAGQHRYSAKGLAFLNALAGGLNVALAAKAAGLSESHARSLWAKPTSKAYIRERALETLALGAPVAAKRVMELVNQDSSKKTALDAAALALGVNAIKPPNGGPGTAVHVNVGFVGTVIHNREQREAFEKLKATGAIPAGAPGYTIDWGIDDDEPAQPAQIEHKAAGAGQGRRGDD